MNSTELIDVVAGRPQFPHHVLENDEFDLNQDHFVGDLLYSGLVFGGGEDILVDDAPPTPCPIHQESLTVSVDRCLAHTSMHEFSVADAFEILYIAWQSAQGKDLTATSNNTLQQLAVRPRASPIDPSVQAFLVDKHSKARGGRYGMSQHPRDAACSPIAVKYQGFRNGEVWWNHRQNGYMGSDLGCFGVVSRKMVRQASQQLEFVGCQCSLVWKVKGADYDVAPSEIRKLVVENAPSFVKFWAERELGRPNPNSSQAQEQQQKHHHQQLQHQTNKRQRTLSIENDNGVVRRKSDERSTASSSVAPGLLAHSCSSSSSAGSESSNSAEIDVVWDHSSNGSTSGSSSSCSSRRMGVRSDEILETKTGMRLQKLPDGTYELLGDLTVRGSVSVDGGLSVAKGIKGQLITPSDACDYAEWFELLNPATEDIFPGHVVQLRSPQQRVTLDTSGCGPIMIVSTKPSLAAGVPSDPIKAKHGVLCAFVGQAPVKVQGTVRVGDPLVPSGLSNGYAVTAFFDWSEHTQPLGTAMEDFITPGIESCPIVLIETHGWLELAKSLIVGRRRTTHRLPDDTPSGVVNTLVRWQHNGRWESAKQYQADIFEAWATAFNLVSADALMLLVQIGFVGDFGAIMLRVLALGGVWYCYHNNYPCYPSYVERDMYMFFMLGIVDMLYQFLDTYTILSHASRLGSGANGLASVGINWNSVEWPTGYVRIAYTLVVCWSQATLFAFSMKLKTRQIRFNDMMSNRINEVEVQRELVPSPAPHILKKSQ